MTVEPMDSEPVPHPHEPGVWTVGALVDVDGTLRPGPAVMRDVHTTCFGYCVLHNPRNHRMRGWPLAYNFTRGRFVRVCPHGLTHPDPDQMMVTRYVGDHECDHCCGLFSDPLPGEEAQSVDELRRQAEQLLGGVPPSGEAEGHRPGP